MTTKTRSRASATILAAALALTLGATPATGSADGSGDGAKDEAPKPRALVLVANPKLDVENLSVRELKRIFLRQQTEIGELSLRPVAHSAVSPEGELFNQRILGMSADDYKSHWMNQQIEGAAKTPTTLKSDRAILIYVRNNPGGIGYVYDTSAREFAEAEADDDDEEKEPLRILTIEGVAWTAPEYVLALPETEDAGTESGDGKSGK